MYVCIVYKTTHTVLKTVPITFLLPKNNNYFKSTRKWQELITVASQNWTSDSFNLSQFEFQFSLAPDLNTEY